MYSSNVVCIVRTGISSPQFVAKNRVKQGGISSPVLFFIYIDDLLLKLADTKVGCWLGPVYTGALAYADDMVSIAHMLLLCNQFAEECNTVFNASKSKRL
jgi:hypothetical protein